MAIIEQHIFRITRGQFHEHKLGGKSPPEDITGKRWS